MKINLMLAAAGTAFLASGGFVNRTLGSFVPKARERGQGKGLRSLNDRLLADIGIDRTAAGFADCSGHLPRQSKVQAKDQAGEPEVS